MGKPNILMVLVDDQGHSDIDMGGGKSEFHTPTLAAWATEGVKLANFYSAATCTPSRAMLMTGRYTIRYGFQDSVIHATEPRGVPLSETFLPEKLKKVGYSTVMIGKWHLGMHMDAYVPLSRGFDEHYGILTGGGSHTKHISVSGQVIARGQDDSHTFSGSNLWDNGAFSQDNKAPVHTTELYTKRTMDVVTKLESDDDSSPWFVFLAFQAIHDPIEVGNEDFITETKCNAISEDTDSNRRIMCGMMAEVDDGLKKVRAKLNDLGAWDRTLVVYASDNGGLTSHGSSNAPFIGQKGTYWEGGVHVPAFVAGGYTTRALDSGGLEAKALEAYAHITDLHTTILGLAGYDAEKEEKAAGIKLDGVDLWSQIVPTDKKAAKAAERSEVLINANSETFGSSGAVISGDYKLMVNPDPAESTIYMHVKAYLQGLDTEPSASEVAKAAMAEAKKSLGGNVYLFNLAKNPTEQDLGAGCADDVETCANLADVDAFADKVEELKDLLKTYRVASAQSSFAWEDDGALANPQMFNNLWSPWRDSEGAPKLVTTGLSKGSSGAPTTAEGLVAALPLTPPPPMTLAASMAAVAAQTSGGEMLTALVGVGALLALVAMAAFTAGQKKERSEYSLVPQH